MTLATEINTRVLMVVSAVIGLGAVAFGGYKASSLLTNPIIIELKPRPAATCNAPPAARRCRRAVTSRSTSHRGRYL